MAFPDTVFLYDRIKEISHSTGAGNLSLDGAATGFGSFSSVYSDGDAVFYAITDGTDYEVGSGHYINNGSSDAISRFAFNSSNSNNNVNFSAGIKEIFVSYPGKFALFSAGGMDGFTQPDVSGMAFFGSQQTVDYSSNVIFDKNNSRLGIVQPAPLYSVDVGGSPSRSLMRSSGIIVAESGIIFSGVSPTHTSSYSGGIQLEPFMRNELDATTGSNAIFSLSGLVEQRLLLDKQIKGSVFAGPASGCAGAGCSPDYPTFRYLAWQDIPDLSHLYTKQVLKPDNSAPYQGNIAFYKESGIFDWDHFLQWDATNNRLGINRSTPTFTLDVDGDGSISGKLDVQKATFLHNNLSVSGNVVVSGNLDVQGDITYIDSSTVTIYDRQLELASMSGTALYGDSALDDAGIAIKSTDYDKKWTWRDSNDSWRTDEGIGASGILEVSGHATFGNDLLVTNNATVSGMFNASGNSTFDGNISAQKKLFVTEDSYFVGATTVSGNLNVSGVSTFNKDTYFTANAPVIMSGTLGVSGDATFDSNVNIRRDVTITGNTYYDQDVVISGTLGVSGNTTLDQKLLFTDEHIKIGLNAGDDYTNALNIINIGTNAGHDGSGARSINIGNTAGETASGVNHIFIGHEAGGQSKFSDETVFIGSQAGFNSSGNYGVFIGDTAGRWTSGCDYSTFLGRRAGDGASGVSYSIAVGHRAGQNALGTKNSANDIYIGRDAAISSSGDNNIFIGQKAGHTASGNNILEITNLGNTFLPNVTDNSDKININEIIVGDNSTKRLSVGNINDVGYLSPSATLQVVPKNTTDVGFMIQAPEDHTANLLEIRESGAVGGDILFSIDSEGSTIVNNTFRVNSGIVGERINIYGNNSLNYLTGGYFFRQTTSDDFSVRINGLGVVPYTRGSAYCGVPGKEFNQVAGNIVNASSGLDTSQLFVYSTRGVDGDDNVHYQRLAISGARYGNFAINTEAAFSGVTRGIDFKAATNFTEDVHFTSNAPVVMSGTLGVSGQTTLNGGLTTYSGGPGVFDPNIVINSSGLLTVPIFNGTAASLATTLPPTTWTSGAIVFVNDPANPKALAVNNGYTWYSGVLS